MPTGRAAAESLGQGIRALPTAGGSLSRPDPHSTSPGKEAGQEPVPPTGSVQPTGRLTSEQLLHWAEATACGKAPFPEGLDPDQKGQLLEHVRRCRRARLVGFIARAITLEMWRTRGQATEQDGKAQTKL